MPSSYKTDLRITLWFLRPYKYRILIIFILLLLYSILDMLSVGAFYPFINSIIFRDKAQPDKGGAVLEHIEHFVRYIPIEDSIVAASCFLIAMVIGSNLFGFFTESFSTWTFFRYRAIFIQKVYGKILNNQYRYFLDNKLGNLLYIGMNATQSVGEMLFYFPKVGVELFRIIAISILLLTISLKISLCIFLVIFIFGIIIHYLSVNIIHPVATNLQKAQSEMTTVFSESVTGIRQIKIYNNILAWYDRYGKQIHNEKKYATINLIYSYIPSKLIQVFGASSIVLTIIYVKVYEPALFTDFLPIIAVYVVALQRMMPSISNVGNHWMGIRSLMPKLRLTYQTLTENSYAISDGDKHFNGLSKEIKLEGISFAYNATEYVLEDVNITIKKGETVAFVGSSGAGKSTLGDLLIRFYRPTQGNITVDGTDYTEYSLASWLAHIGMVSQDTFIFNASIKDNIRMGKEGASDEEIIRAAEVADASAFINDMPNGYDTVVGDRGMKLSGGQRQRVAIARAVIKNPDILILDEATSALDNISEKVVQEALEKAARSRTNIIIAHRLSTIEKADRIFVLNKGYIVEDGTHTELLERRGIYYHLYESQQESQE